MAKLLIAYQSLHGCHTTTDFISRWAPSSENDTKAYIAAVNAIAGKAIFDLTEDSDLSKLCSAICVHENGARHYNDSVNDALFEGIKLARQ